jgi:hypothetical protein
MKQFEGVRAEGDRANDPQTAELGLVTFETNRYIYRQ